MIRPFSDADYDSIAEILRTALPNVPWAVSSLRHDDEANRRAGLVCVRQVVDEPTTHRVVAYSELGQNPYQYHPRKFWVAVRVLPEFRHHGLGTRLYDSLLQEAHRREAVGLRTAVLESDPSAVDFARHRGFAVGRKVWQSVLDVDSANVTRFEAIERRLRNEGVEFTTLAEEGRERPETAERLHDLELAVTGDIPRVDEVSLPTLEQFRQHTLEAPSVLPDAWFIAKWRDRFIGESYAERLEARPDTLLQHLTATRKEYRRRGLATALKVRVIDYAKRHHYTSVRTFNDSMNDPIWKLNEKLGFRREETRLQMELSLG